MRLLGGLVGYLASSLESILDTRLDYMRGFVGILSVTTLRTRMAVVVAAAVVVLAAAAAAAFSGRWRR